MAKVLMLVTNGYRPDPRVHKEAKTLVGSGHDVDVVAWDREGKRPLEETVDGVRVLRVRAGRGTGVLHLVGNYPLFFLQALTKARRSRPQVVHAHDLDTLPLGVLISWLNGVPLVYDAHERYSEMIAVDAPAAVSSAVQRLEDVLMQKASLVVTVNDPIAEVMRPQAPCEVLVLMNCIELPPRSSMREHVARDDIVLLSPTTFEPMRYIEESTVAVAKIERCILRIAGQGRLQAAVEKASREHGNIHYLGFLPHHQVVEEYLGADAVLLLMDPRNENNRMGLPNKMGEAMAYGLPLIASQGTLSGDIVDKAGCGIAIDWGEENFRAAVDRLRSVESRAEMGRKGREAAEREYNWGLMGRRLIDAYARLLGKGKAE